LILSVGVRRWNAGALIDGVALGNRDDPDSDGLLLRL
jgi:hypothetical protein